VRIEATIGDLKTNSHEEAHIRCKMIKICYLCRNEWPITKAEVAKIHDDYMHRFISILSPSVSRQHDVIKLASHVAYQDASHGT
jgi:hypothetical protein